MCLGFRSSYITNSKSAGKLSSRQRTKRMTIYGLYLRSEGAEFYAARRINYEDGRPNPGRDIESCCGTL
jgi:hypothetical protein